jgi:hypothetical protein
MGDAPDRDVQEVIDWWKEYGFKRSESERADAGPLFRELLERMNGLSIEKELQVFECIDENG